MAISSGCLCMVAAERLYSCWLISQHCVCLRIFITKRRCIINTEFIFSSKKRCPFLHCPFLLNNSSASFILLRTDKCMCLSLNFWRGLVSSASWNLHMYVYFIIAFLPLPTSTWEEAGMLLLLQNLNHCHKCRLISSASSAKNAFSWTCLSC